MLNSSPSRVEAHRPAWREVASARFAQSIETPARFFDLNAESLSLASLAMAKRFQRGGRLLVFGTGSSVTDAQHVSVEFVHPVIVGKQALPAIALTNDIASVLALAQTAGVDRIFDWQLRLLGTADDIALGIALDGGDASVRGALRAAKALGMLTIYMCGAAFNAADGCDFTFAVPSSDPYVIQEVQETAYHILWETVHVFFEHKDLLA